MKAGVLCLAIGSMASTALARPAPADTQSARCEVAALYIGQILAKERGHKLAFSTETVPLETRPDRRSWFNAKTFGLGAVPPKKLMDRFVRTDGNSAVARCSSVQAALTRHQVPYGEEAVDAAGQIKDGTFLFKAGIYSISLPVLGRNGREALVAVAGAFGPTAAGSYIEYLKRTPSGNWIVVSEAELTVA